MTTIAQQVAMSDEEIYEFLENHQTAVMSLNGEERPYSIPITYRFDAEKEQFYFRLVYPRRSEKREFLPDVPECVLVSYIEDDPIYQSVMARGHPEEIEEEDIDPEMVTQLGETSRPLFEMWVEDRSSLDIRLYKLDCEELTGRRINTQKHNE
jgi:nitroimidazol reductase NimA-like FMN-containing flavoprotein (pyridoxamine 5'-phosphate oxidase superfamily)